MNEAQDLKMAFAHFYLLSNTSFHYNQEFKNYEIKNN